MIICPAFFLPACDQMKDVVSGASKTDTRTANADLSDTTSGDASPAKVRLDAFIHFKCTDGWSNRDGGLGLKAGTGTGKCTTVFAGPPSRYRVTLMAQLEFDGSPEYKIVVDGATIAAGRYPLSKGELICDCPNWRVNCPDRVVPIDAGVHQINKGSVVEFIGAEVYPCGTHGAYAKWREIVLTPSG